MKYQKEIGIIYESLYNKNTISNKDLFFGLKALLDDGDDFKLLTDRSIFTDGMQSMSTQFVYKGTRNIRVFTSCFFNNKDYDDVRDITVTIFEVTPEGKTIEKLDTNAFNIEEIKNWKDHLGIGHDPHIRSVEGLVGYVKQVLDRSDRDFGEDDVVVPPSKPDKEKRVSEFLSKHKEYANSPGTKYYPM